MEQGLQALEEIDCPALFVLLDAQPELERHSVVRELRDRLGRFGQKVGKGWYDYEAGKREPVASAEVQACIDKVRADKGVTPRAISDDEIVSDGHCLSISDAIGRRLRDGDKIRYKLKLSERGERH